MDVCLCHYSEPAEQTIISLEKILAMEYPSSKLTIYVCDDGYLSSKGWDDVSDSLTHWPTAALNKNCIATGGDVRNAVAELMEKLAGDASSIQPDGTGPKTTESRLPQPSDPSRVVPRIDCAVGYECDTFAVPGLPVVKFVARLKPKEHHSKVRSPHSLRGTGWS